MTRSLAILLSLLAIAALIGCSAPEERPLSKEHPASPDAPEAPVAARSKTLDVATADPLPTARPPEPRPATATPAPAGGHAGHGAATKPVYRCPMDPEVVSDKPDRCPKCGMKLELVQ